MSVYIRSPDSIVFGPHRPQTYYSHSWSEYAQFLMMRDQDWWIYPTETPTLSNRVFVIQDD